MKPISVLVLFAAGCGASGNAASSSVEELRAAVPQKSWLAMAPVASQQGAGGATADGASACAAAGPSTFGTLTHQIAGNADGVLDGVLGTVAQITQGPPAAAEPGHAVWGPIGSATSSVYRLEVAATAPSQFHFVLAGRDASSDWRGIFVGDTVAPDASHHAGDVAVDFAAMHALDGTTDPLAGNVNVHFAADGAAHDVAATFAGIVGKPSVPPDDAQYRMITSSDQSAVFRFATRVDFDGDGTQDEVAQIESHWSATGAGVAHLAVTGGSLGTRVVNAVECWDPSLSRLFYTDDASMHPASGDPACCPF
jgi:hypothetical protein